MPAQVAKVQHIFLETGSTKTYRALEEFWADLAVRTNRFGNLIHIGLTRLTKSRNRINARNPLG